MSKHFFYIQFRVTPKGTFAKATGNEMISIDFHRNMLAIGTLKRPGRNTSDEAIATDLASVVAIATVRTFASLGHRPLMEQEIPFRLFPGGASFFDERVSVSKTGARRWCLPPSRRRVPRLRRSHSHGVRVNAVAPGPVWTPLIPSTLPKDKVKEFGSHTVFGRAAQPVEIAPIFVFLASGQSSYVTGEIYGAMGGQMPM